MHRVMKRHNDCGRKLQCSRENKDMCLKELNWDLIMNDHLPVQRLSKMDSGKVIFIDQSSIIVSIMVTEVLLPRKSIKPRLMKPAV